MNIIKREFKANFLGFLIWIVALGLLYFAASAEYEVFATNEEVLDFMNDPTMQQLFSLLGSDTTDITTPQGYLSLVSFYIYLPMAIYSGLLGSGIISKEEKNKTAEYLFTLPVKRNKVLASKLLVATVYSLLLNVILLSWCYYAFGRLGTTHALDIFVINMMIGIFIIQLIFLSLGLLLSSALKQYKKSGSITVGILIGTFMISMLSGLTDKADFLKYFTPFKYYTTSDMMVGNFQSIYILLSLLIIIPSLVGFFYYYQKRDLYI